MVCLTHKLFSSPILASSQVNRLRFFSEISHFASLVITIVRKVRFQKEKLQSVAQSELFQMVCLTHKLFSSSILAFSQVKISYFNLLMITLAKKVMKKSCF